MTEPMTKERLEEALERHRTMRRDLNNAIRATQEKYSRAISKAKEAGWLSLEFDVGYWQGFHAGMMEIAGLVAAHSLKAMIEEGRDD